MAIHPDDRSSGGRGHGRHHLASLDPTRTCLASAFVFATAMHTSVLGALLTVASRLWYPTYALRGEAFQVNVSQDQQLAGLIMWVPAGTLLALLSLGLFAAWLGEAERRVARAESKR